MLLSKNKIVNREMLLTKPLSLSDFDQKTTQIVLRAMSMAGLSIRNNNCHKQSFCNYIIKLIYNNTYESYSCRVCLFGRVNLWSCWSDLKKNSNVA